MINFYPKKISKIKYRYSFIGESMKEKFNSKCCRHAANKRTRLTK